jgi:hypothetical protein
MSLIKEARLSALGISAILCIIALALTSVSAAAQNRARVCNSYADDALEQQETNEELDCGFSGPRWSDNRTNHFAWCMLFPQRAEAEQEARREQLRECRRDARGDRRDNRRREIAGKRASCDTYAKTTVVQAQANQKYKCGYRGGEWVAQERPHLRWCMRARRQFLADEIRYRQVELQKCFDKLGDYDEDQEDRGYRRRRF